MPKDARSSRHTLKAAPPPGPATPTPTRTVVVGATSGRPSPRPAAKPAPRPARVRPKEQAPERAQAEPELPMLLVDDDAAVRDALSALLKSFGYAVESAASGEAALAALARSRFSILLCDIRMPGLDGIEVIRVALDVDPDLGIIMVTGAVDAGTATAALTAGAWDYLMKPVESSILRAAVQRALRRRTATLRRTQHAIEREVATRTAAIEHERLALRSVTISTVEALLKAMEARDPYLVGHSQRMAALAADVAAALGLDPESVEHVRLAARLADIGKIGLRTEVMNKPGRLTPEEFDHVQDHVRLGVEILSPLSHLGVVLEYVRDHHEHYDGTGYPRAVAGDAISIGGRILAAADAFVALTSRRAYREPMTPLAAIDHLRESAGSLLDWSVYAALRSVVQRGAKTGSPPASLVSAGRS
jgi:putative two-component system response regulator